MITSKINIKTRAGLILLCLIFCNVYLIAQNVNGLVVDNTKQGIIGASVILQTPDSVFIDACVTDIDGKFAFKKSLQNYRLIIQHLTYKTKLLNITDGKLTLPIVLDDKSEQLKEVVVKGSRPIVKVAENGALVYNAKQLIANRPVISALDLLGEVPGVIKNNENYSIVGAGQTSIIINGHKRSMSVEDLNQLLAYSAPSQVKSVEVFYNTPPQYGVKGGCINVVMDEKRSEKTTWNGNAFTTLYMGSEYYQTGGLNMSVFQKRWAWNVGYSLGNVNKNIEENFISHHRLGNEITDLSMITKRNSKSMVHQFKTDFNYTFKNKDKLSFFYIGKIGKPKNTASSPLLINDVESTLSRSDVHKEYNSHSFIAEYNHKQMTLGGDYVLYDSDSRHKMINSQSGQNEVSLNELNSSSSQKVNKGNLYMNSSAKIGNGRFTYGMDASLSSTKNTYLNEWQGGNYENEASNSTQKEYTADVFAGWSQKLGKETKLSANFQLQYYHAEMNRNGINSTLWNGFYLFPNITLNHSISNNQAVVFSLSSDRKYPGYAATDESKSYRNSYVYSVGNASLKPYTSYETHLNYILKGKYVFGLMANITPDWSTQQIYQDTKELQASYRWINFDYNHQLGILAILPHSWNSYVNSRLVCNFIYEHHKGILVDIPFNREQFVCAFNLSNNFMLDKAKTWTLQLNGNYQTAIQGMYDVHPILNTSAALAWNPKKSGWSLTLKANDLFNTSIQKLDVNYGGQHLNFRYDRDVRYLSLTVRYTINGYKQKKERQVDTSRMGL